MVRKIISATATITGIGNYSGTKSVNFTIKGSGTQTEPSAPGGSSAPEEPEDDNATTLPAEPDKGKDFTDVKNDAWYINAIDTATGYGLFGGVSETTFEPKTGMTRGMLAQTLYNLSGKTDYGTDGDNFTDADGWYQNAVNWAAATYIE